MKTINLTYPSKDGQTTIRAWLKEPDKVASGKQLPRGVIQIIHGAAEHSGRYAYVAKYFVDKGFVVCGHDHVGHGQSVESPADLGHMPLTGGMKVLIEDTHHLRMIVQPRYLESVPYVMLGHSMGSYVLRVYLSDYGRGLAAAVLTGTSQPNLVRMIASVWLARFIAKRQGERSYSKLLHNQGFGSLGKKVKGHRTEFDWLCSDPEVVDAYIADPLCGFRFSNGAYATLAHVMRDMVTNAIRAYTPKRFSILCLSGTEDPLGNSSRGPQAVAKAYRSAAIQNADAITYPGMRHEIFNEPDKRRVLHELLGWLERRIGV